MVDQDGDSSLSYSIIDGHIKVTRLRLDRVANPAIANNERFTPLSLEAEQGHLEISKLLERGVHAAASSEHRNKALDCASANGHHEIFELLNIYFKSRSEESLGL